MKKVIFFLALLFTLPSFAQEEFLRTAPGISASYIHANKPNTDNLNSFKVNNYLGDGVSAYILGTIYETEIYPTFGLNFMLGNKEKNTHLLGILGASHSKASDFMGIGLSGGFMQCIHSHSNFPLSLQAKAKYFASYMNDESASVKREVLLGLGYHQAFFAHNDIYPYLGFSSSVDILNRDINNDSNIIYTITIGFNINLGD